MAKENSQMESSNIGGQPGNQNAVGNAGGGAPTKYRMEFDNQAYEMSMLGLTEKEIAGVLEVSESTIGLWKKEHLSFSEALRGGKIIADGKVAIALYKRAIGYEYTETTYEAIVTDKETDVAKEMYKKKVVVKDLPPDVGAATMWLKNRHKEKWRDKQSFEIELERLSDDQLQILYDRVISKIDKLN